MASDDRPSSFQPEKPYASGETTSGKPRYFVAVVVALLTGMLLAFATPRLFEASPLLRWLLTLGGGVIAFLAVVGMGWIQGLRE